uniref:shikimate dehydrogenase (NADP(+)) n=1 Tax=Salix viminalis TaxID=40686 RepID=A0A6N2M9I9_SALVM
MAFKNSLSVCTPLECESVGEMLASMKRAEAEGADLAELRLDSLSFSHDSEVEKLIKHRTLPSIVSFRLKPSGISSNRDRKNTCLQLLRLAFDLNVEFVEMDYEVASEDVMAEYVYNRSNTKLIVSSYVNGTKPSAEELGYLIACMQSTGADVLKLVLDVEKITDLAPVFTMLSHCQVLLFQTKFKNIVVVAVSYKLVGLLALNENNIVAYIFLGMFCLCLQMPLIALAVGSRGLISQLLGPKFGGVLVYGSLSDKAVPGMPTLLSLRQVYKLEYINADTKVFGLISNPVGHSKGPILHNPAFRHTGYNGIYVPMQVDDVKEFFWTYTSSDFAGFSVGIPHKEAAVGCCDEVHPLAKSIGAVNTIVRRPTDGKLVGYNTDCDASISAIEDALTERRITQKGVVEASPLAGKTLVLIGAGGAGRALAFGAKSRGARVIIFNRDYERARALAKAVSGEALPYESLDRFRPENGMILANASAIGMEPNSDQSPVSKEALKAYELVFDAVYTPRNTRLLQEAKEVGAVVVSGVEMFIRQALGQFRLFTGGLAPEAFMRKLVLEQF